MWENRGIGIVEKQILCLNSVRFTEYPRLAYKVLKVKLA